MSVPYIPPSFHITTVPATDDAYVFPALRGEAFRVEKGPDWSAGTVSKTSVSGRRTDTTYETYPIWRFQLRFDFLRQRAASDDLARLWAFYNANYGPLGSFFLYDPYDYQVASSQSLGTGDGTTTTFQLTRTIGGSPRSFIDPVRCVYGTPTVTVAGSPTSAFSYGNYGQITFNSAPTAGQAIAWTGSFLYWVKFSDPTLTAEQMLSDLWSKDGLALESVKP